MKIWFSKNKNNIIVIAPFLFITFCFFVLYFFYPKHDSSETENRLLAQKPTLKYENIKNFPKEFDNFINDQLPFREKFLKLYSSIELMQNKINVRDLYIVDGNLLPREYLYYESDIQKSTSNTNDLMKFVINSGKVSVYVSLPYKTSVYNNILPDYLQTNYGKLNFEHFTEKLYKDIKICDAFRCYEGQSINQLEKYFFKTDLHWNIEGASVAFKYMMNWLYEENLIPIAVNDESLFKFDYLDDSQYLGDLNRRYSYILPTNEAIPVFNQSNDNIKIYLSYFENNYTTDFKAITAKTNEKTETYNSIYSSNLGYYKMVNDNSLLNTNVLVIKDSMQNAMTGMFSKVFNTTEVVDIRFLTDIGLYKIIQTSNADLVILMYHQNNITGEMFEFK